MSEKLGAVATAIFNTGFHPDDVQNGNAAKKWQEWPDDAAKAMRQARASVEALRNIPAADLWAMLIDRFPDGQPMTAARWKENWDAILEGILE